MSTNPLDLKGAIPRLVEIGNLKQIDLQKPITHTQQLSLSNNRKNDLKKSRINETIETGKLYVQHSDNSFNKKGKEKEKDKKRRKNIGHLDIKI